jgi:hypothetical protein
MNVFDDQAETARLFARLSMHEFLLENLYAIMLSADPEPEAAVHKTAERALELIGHAYGRPTVDLKMMQGLMDEMREQTARFFRKVERRVSER